MMIGESDVIIKSLHIKGLYGKYDYDIEFNEDLTFLYGSNGCGKTTILTILDCIMTGEIDDLLSYEFNNIKLYYTSMGDNSCLKLIEINITENRMTLTIDNQKILDLSPRDLDSEFPYIGVPLFYKTKVFGKMKELFNYIYWSLSRDNFKVDRTRDVINQNGFPIFHKNDSNESYNKNGYLSNSLESIAAVVKDRYTQIVRRENSLSEEYRNNILTSAIMPEKKSRLNRAIMEMDRLTPGYIQDVKAKYREVLDNFGLSYTSEQIEDFFSGFLEELKTFREKNVENGTPISLLWKYTEIMRIEEITSASEDIERKKQEVRKPIKDFEEIINLFFDASDGDKRLEVTPDGSIIFRTKRGDSLSLSDLSSGEKHLVILFTGLIFGLDNDKQGIFIVDEPDTSLHLLWQRLFVPSILKLNKNIQLIFATHSPEIIGQYRSNLFEVKRKYSEERYA